MRAETMGNTQGAVFDDIEIGQDIPKVEKGPLTPMHLVRWSAAMENWHRIHYDREFATGHDRLPDLLVNGSFKQQFIVQLLKDWAGPAGWVWKAGFQFRAMNQVGETLRVWARHRQGAARPLRRRGSRDRHARPEGPGGHAGHGARGAAAARRAARPLPLRPRRARRGLTRCCRRPPI
jgi:acyl dehydratase